MNALTPDASASSSTGRSPLRTSLEPLCLGPLPPAGAPPVTPAAPTVTPLSGSALLARFHQVVNPSSTVLARGQSSVQKFASGGVERGPDGTAVAFGQAGLQARAVGVALVAGSTEAGPVRASGLAAATASITADAFVQGAAVKSAGTLLAVGQARAEAQGDVRR